MFKNVLLSWKHGFIPVYLKLQTRYDFVSWMENKFLFIHISKVHLEFQNSGAAPISQSLVFNKCQT